MPSMIKPEVLQSTIERMDLRPDQLAVFMAFAKGAGLIDERVVFAMRQFELGTERAVICQRMMNLYDIAERTAYRLTEQALEMRRKSAMEMATNRPIVKAE